MIQYKIVEDTVYASERYHGSVISASAICNGVDERNHELGKAIARARIELKVRKNEIERLKKTKKAVETLNMTELKRNVICHFIHDISAEIRLQSQYLSNQNKLIRLLTKGDVGRWSGMTDKEIMQTAFDEVMER